jgi:hypothetical protein
LVDGPGPAFGSGVFVALEETNHLNQVSSAIRRDRGGASKERAGCGLRVDGIVLAQPAADGTIRPVDLHYVVPDGQELTAQASPKGPGAFHGKNRPAAQLKSPVLENAVTLTISRNAALAKAPAMGRQRHGDMELLVGIDADYDVWMVSPLGLCQCC